MGLSKPVHVLQHGAEVNEIVDVATVAVVDAQETERRMAVLRGNIEPRHDDYQSPKSWPYRGFVTRKTKAMDQG